MPRQIAFYIPRLNHLKVVAPVIEYLVRRHPQAFRATILFPGWPISKSALQPRLKDFHTIFGDRVAAYELQDASAFVHLIKTGSLDALVNLTTQVAELDEGTVQRLRAASLQTGTKWIALPYLFAQDQFIVASPRVALATWDLICVPGPHSADYIRSHLNGAASEVTRALRDRLVITGYPELDGIDTLSDEKTIRHNYGLPLDKPIVFLAPSARLYPQSNHSRTMHGVESRFLNEWDFSPHGLVGLVASMRYPVVTSYRRFLSVLRAFADRNNACLVAKTRAKHRDPHYLTDYVDYVFNDQSFFPFTTLELLRVSSLYVGFWSVTALEAVAMGLYAVTMVSIPLRLTEPIERLAWSGEFYHRPGGLWNTPGVSEQIDGTRRSCHARLNQLARSSLDAYAVDEARRIQLLDQFVSYRGTSSAKFAEALVACWS